MVQNLRFFTHSLWKSPPFPRILRPESPFRIAKSNSQGAIFVIILIGAKLTVKQEHLSSQQLPRKGGHLGERKGSTSTVTGLFSKTGLRGQKIAVVDMNLQFPNAVVLNTAGRRNTETSAKERKCLQKSANASPQKSACWEKLRFVERVRDTIRTFPGKKRETPRFGKPPLTKRLRNILRQFQLSKFVHRHFLTALHPPFKVKLNTISAFYCTDLQAWPRWDKK